MRKYVLGVALLLLGARCSFGASPDRWVEARSTHFVVLTDAGEKQSLRLTSQFERMRAVFHALLPSQGDDADQPIVVVAVKDRKGMQALEPAAYLEKKQVDLAGFFVRGTDKNYILMRLDAQEEHPFATVYHEYTHYMLRKADGWLPLWLNEGLAQFYENTDIDEKNVWLGQANSEELQYLKFNPMLPLATLLAVDTRSPYYHDEHKGSIFYAESWALTHFLIVSDRIAGTHTLRDYSQLLAQGASPVAAAQQAFGDLGKLQQALAAYVAQRHFMYFMMPVELTPKDAEFEVRSVATAAADAVRADVLLYTRRNDEAQALLRSVLREDPNNEPAHESMGLLLLRQGDIAGANVWYGRAVALNANSYAALFNFASTALRSGGSEENGAIESSLRTAIRLNPQFAPAYDALAMYLASRHLNLDEARLLTQRAVQLDPGQLSFRLNRAEVLTQARQFANAIGLLQAALTLARSPEEIATVQGRIQRVASYQTAVASAYARAN